MSGSYDDGRIHNIPASYKWLSSYNVSSVTENGAGKHRITFLHMITAKLSCDWHLALGHTTNVRFTLITLRR